QILIRQTKKRTEEIVKKAHFGPAAVVPGGRGAGVAGRKLGGGLRVRPVWAGKTGGVLAVRLGLIGPELG
ncbi:UNVERIFIED_CONTAM: hypothetical protein C3P02_20385, partial [Clostridioides difficile]